MRNINSNLKRKQDENIPRSSKSPVNHIEGDDQVDTLKYITLLVN